LGCLFSCLHKILPTWSLSIPAATVTQIHFQRAGAELMVCSYNSFCPTFMGLSCCSLLLLKPSSRTGSGTPEGTARKKLARKRRLLRCKGQRAWRKQDWWLWNKGSQWNRCLRLPFPPLHSFLPNMAWPGKNHFHLPSDQALV